MDTGLEPQGAAPADRHLGDLPAVVARHAGAATRTTRTTGCSPAAAAARRRRGRPRHRAGGQRPARTRRSAAERLPARPRVPVPAAGELRPVRLDGGDRPGPLPPGALHLPPPLDAVSHAANFDAPNGDFSCVRRTRSNTPLQALTTLNETVFMECGRALAVRVLKEQAEPTPSGSPTPSASAFLRAPEADEVTALKTLLEKQRKRVSDGWVNPAEIATGEAGGKITPPEGTTPAQVALYTLVSRVLLNMDETITKE